MFYNFSTKKFVGSWGGKPYSFEAGKVYPDGIIISDDGSSSVQLNEVTSAIFAHHLAVKILNEDKEVAGNALKYNMTNLDMLKERAQHPPNVEKALPEFKDVLSIQPELKAEVVEDTKEQPVVEATVSEPEKKKPGRPKKVSSPSPEAEFNV